jgi:2-dehydro-3-deoxygalactonokinase
MIGKKFLSCDWGSSSFRLRLIDATNSSVNAEISNDRGIAAVYKEFRESGLPEKERAGFYKKILTQFIRTFTTLPMDGLPVIISGMASSSIGFAELPYANLPLAIKDAAIPIQKISADKNIPYDLVVVSGIRTANDVMRGEETILLGCPLDDKQKQLIIFPGTHSKHVIVQHGIVHDFKTYMTGELFDLLSSQSILSASLENENNNSANNAAFQKGVLDAFENDFLNAIFHVRTNQVFNKLNKKDNYYYLSGVLIGEELKSIPNNEYGSVVIISNGILSSLYREALSVTCFKEKLIVSDARDAFVKGHNLIFAKHF